MFEFFVGVPARYRWLFSASCRCWSSNLSIATSRSESAFSRSASALARSASSLALSASAIARPSGVVVTPVKSSLWVWVRSCPAACETPAESSPPPFLHANRKTRSCTSQLQCVLIACHCKWWLALQRVRWALCFSFMFILQPDYVYSQSPASLNSFLELSLSLH